MTGESRIRKVALSVMLAVSLVTPVPFAGAGQAIAAPAGETSYPQKDLLEVGLKGTGQPLPLTATKPDGMSIQVICYVSGDGPRRWSAERITFGVSVLCDGAIRNVTLYLYVFRQVSDSLPYSGFASRGPESAVGTPFIVSVNRDDPVCLPADYVGVAHVIVDFLSGYPLHLEGVFGTGEIFIGC
jgi:hypothetical protein